jgi:hypothetical protein
MSEVPFVENNFRWKKELLQVVPLKMYRFVTRKRDRENLKIILTKDPVRAGPRQVRFIKIGVLSL